MEVHVINLTTNSIRYNKLFFLNYHFFGKSFQTELKLNMYNLNPIVIYEPSAGRRCSRMSAFFKARATKERVPLIKARMNGRCLHASGSYNIFCTKIKLIFFF
jgi:hypothetical protein